MFQKVTLPFSSQEWAFAPAKASNESEERILNTDTKKLYASSFCDLEMPKDDVATWHRVKANEGVTGVDKRFHGLHDQFLLKLCHLLIICLLVFE